MATKKISYRGMICESQVFANITSGFQKVCESACAQTTQKVDECGDQTAIAEGCAKKAEDDTKKVSRPKWLKEGDTTADAGEQKTDDSQKSEDVQTQNPADQTTVDTGDQAKTDDQTADAGTETTDANANTETPAPTVVNGSEGETTVTEGKKVFKSLFKKDDGCADGKCEKKGKLSDLVNESKKRKGKTFGYAPIVAPLAPEGGGEGGGEGGCCMGESCCGDKKIVKEGALEPASGSLYIVAQVKEPKEGFAVKDAKSGEIMSPVYDTEEKATQFKRGMCSVGEADEGDDAGSETEVEDKDDDAKKVALAKHFDVKPEEVTYNGYTYEVDGTEWKVFTEEEAEKAARDYIREALWAFNADFILKHCATCKDMFDSEREETKKAIGELTGKLCESSNGIVLALIGGEAGLEAFCKDAISADGRANFLSTYDGNEVELGDGFLAYREN